MKHFLSSTILAVSLTSSFSNPALADDLPGYDHLTVSAKHRPAAMQGFIWYPQSRKTYKNLIGDNQIFHGKPAFVGAAIAEGTYPLVLISHGSGGNMDNMSWLASGLSKRGAVVLGVNHPGSTSGDSSPRRSIHLWDRPQDVSAALDHILDDPHFGPHINQDEIYSVGFSMGGYTVLQLAGIQGTKRGYIEYCNEMGDAAADCLFFNKGGVNFEHIDSQAFDASYVDKRISKTVAVDPGMTYALQPATVAAVETPVQLINLGEGDDRWAAVDLESSGSGLTDALPNVTYSVVAPAHHYSFLGSCKPAAPAILSEEGEDPICDDPEGSDREVIHNRINDEIAKFLFSE